MSGGTLTAVLLLSVALYPDLKGFPHPLMSTSSACLLQGHLKDIVNSLEGDRRDQSFAPNSEASMPQLIYLGPMSGHQVCFSLLC